MTLTEELANDNRYNERNGGRPCCCMDEMHGLDCAFLSCACDCHNDEHKAERVK